MAKKQYKPLLRDISTFIFDVDGVLAQNSLLVTTDGEYLRLMNSKDGHALRMAVEKGYRVVIISRGSNEGIRKRLIDFGTSDIFLGVMDKLQVMKQYLTDHNVDLKNVLYMGDDIPDIACMQCVGVATCPQDAVKEVKDVAIYISHIDGGMGCARDVVEQTMKVQGKWYVNPAKRH